MNIRDTRLPILLLAAVAGFHMITLLLSLGNLNDKRLRDMLFTGTHCQAARDGFALKCPTCMCKIDSRIRRHSASVRRHGE